MTCIVNFKTKKEFKNAVNNNEFILMENPSIFEPYSGNLKNYFDTQMERGKYNYVETFTNHPKRSWFASVHKKQGKLVVK